VAAGTKRQRTDGPGSLPPTSVRLLADSAECHHTALTCHDCDCVQVATISRDTLRQAIDDKLNPLEEYARAVKSSRNALAPISRLPLEIITAIFSFFSHSAWSKEAGPLAWMRVAHVCSRWRDIALKDPLFWSHINFTKLTPVGVAEILARAKMAPLNLEADVTFLSEARLDAFERQLEAHISHTRHLSISGPHLQSALDRLIIPCAPMLEFLSLTYKHPRWKSRPPPQVIIPANLFNCTRPSLTRLELKSCDISWASPLLKRLRTLEILRQSASREARPELGNWLDALNEIPQLETLILQSATPLAPLAGPLALEPTRAVTLPSLTRFHISDSAKGCALALAYLVLPALAWLRVDASVFPTWENEGMGLLIPYVVQHVSGLQDTEPLRSILISGERESAEVLAWTLPEADVKVCDSDTLLSASVSARLMFVATGIGWPQRTDTAIFDAFLALLPMKSVSTLSVLSDTQLNKEFWLGHTTRFPLLEQARLVPTAVKAFRDMLAEDPSPDGPRLPSLTKLILVDVKLNGPRAYHLRDMLMERAEQGAPLEVLDLRTCLAGDRAIQSLTEIVVEVQALWPRDRWRSQRFSTGT
jgi:hypothetical protein